jgi:hypothetical protein
MATQFALIQASTVTQLFPTDPHMNAAVDVRDVSGVTGIAVGWTVDDSGNFHPPVAGNTWEDARMAASNELTQAMNIVVRCLEKQQLVPNAWIIYRDTLRVVRDSETGDPAAPFPVRPAYPPGIDPPPGYPPGVSAWPPGPAARSSMQVILPGSTTPVTGPQELELTPSQAHLLKLQPKKPMAFGMG